MPARMTLTAWNRGMKNASICMALLLSVFFLATQATSLRLPPVAARIVRSYLRRALGR